MREPKPTPVPGRPCNYTSFWKQAPSTYDGSSLEEWLSIFLSPSGDLTLSHYGIFDRFHNLIGLRLKNHVRLSSVQPEMASVDFKTYVDQACRAAEEFVNVYYTTMDKRRRQLSRLYMNTATMVWNGNAVSGQESLSEFFEMLPSSEFQINVVDCQPVHDEATPSQTTVLVVICGTVKFEGNKQRDFNQTFILTAQASPTNTVWKIASDCFRFQDWTN